MITEMITSGQRKQLLRVLEDAVDSATLTKEQADEILKSGNMVHIDVKSSLAKHAIADKSFGPAVKEFEFTVPSDYTHDTQLDTFAKKTKKLKTTYYFNDDLNSKNFANATNKLVPGKTYKVKIFPILATVTSEDCMLFLKKQNAILVGGQGITVLQDQKPDEFPIGKWTISFDEKETLWKDAGGRHRVPGVNRISDGVWVFYLGDFERAWGDGHALLCFCDM